MNPTVYYHTFTGKEEVPKCSNLRVPTLLSIATLRAVNPDIAIVVLDGSENMCNNPWGKYKESLNFQVWGTEFHLTKRWQHIRGWQHLSRLFDLNRRTRRSDIIYCDSDVFWVKDPLPLSCDEEGFCFDGFNTGFFYYKQTELMKQFFEIFEAYTISAMADLKIRERLKAHVGYEAWHDVWDEMIMTFMAHHHKDLINIIPLHEHCTARRMTPDAKMFHANGTMVSNRFPQREGEREHSRGLLCLVIKEFYENICKVLDPADIFTQEQIDYYVPHQFSLFDNWEDMKTGDGHYHIKRRIHPPNLII
jgi:hypothetical protein